MKMPGHHSVPMLYMYRVSFKKVYPSLNVSYRKSTEYFRKRQISGKRSECPLSNGVRFIMSLPWITEQVWFIGV